MFTKLRVKIITQSSSAKRGIGFYGEHLIEELKKNPDFLLTDINPDVIHYLFFDLFNRTLPFKKEARTVVTIHDLTPLVMANRYPRGAIGTFNLLSQRLSLLGISAIVTDSLNSKKDLIRIFKIDEEKIFVIPLSCDEIFKQEVSEDKKIKVKKKYTLPDKFVLNVSAGPNANKNLPLLSQVTNDLEIPLVIIGRDVVQKLPPGFIHPELSDLAKLQEYHNLILPGFVPIEDLSVIYKLATLYCQPSLYEGFGIPVLEAMSSGCLLVCSNSSSLPELYPSGTITFNPKEIDDLKKALQKGLTLSSPERQKLIKEAEKRANDFSWGKTAQLTAQIYQKIIFPGK